MTAEPQEAEVPRTTVNVSIICSTSLDEAWVHYNSWRLRHGLKKVTKRQFTDMVIESGLGIIETTMT